MLVDLDRLGVSPPGYAMLILTVEILVVGAFAATATVLYCLRSDEPMVLLVALLLVTFGAMSGTVVRAPWALVAQYEALGMVCRALAWVAYVLLVLFCLLFPDGHFVPAWSGWLAPALALVLAAWIFSAEFPAGDPSAMLHPATFALLGGLGGLQLYRYLRHSDATQRQQTRWVVFGVAGSTLGFLEAIFAAYGFTTEIRPAVNATAVQLVGFVFAGLAQLAVPLSFGVAVTRRHLFEVDFFLNRALVYGALTAGVVGGYALVVGLSSQLFRTEGFGLIPLVTTGLIAVLFQPLRAQFQRGVNRLMYGERDDPASVVAALGRRLDTPLEPGAALLVIAETVGIALKLPAVAITLRHRDGGFSAARYPPGDSAATGADRVHLMNTLPLTYGGETVGELRVAPRPGETGLGPTDRRLLADLARQAGVAVSAIRLSADLQAARERLVLAREEERRRLRRDLHDGLGPRLAALTLRLDTARDTLTADPRADALLGDLAARMADAVADIRRLVYDLRPPALDDFGLVGALRGAAEGYGSAAPCITVEAPDPLPPLPAAVEVAAYRIAQEALANAVRHARASRCTVRLSFDLANEALVVTIEDDGVGIAPERRAGVGSASMRERAEELGGSCVIQSPSGGGTRVCALLPCLAATVAHEAG